MRPGGPQPGSRTPTEIIVSAGGPGGQRVRLPPPLVAGEASVSPEASGPNLVGQRLKSNPHIIQPALIAPSSRGAFENSGTNTAGTYLTIRDPNEGRSKRSPVTDKPRVSRAKTTTIKFHWGMGTTTTTTSSPPSRGMTPPPPSTLQPFARPSQPNRSSWRASSDRSTAKRPYNPLSFWPDSKSPDNRRPEGLQPPARKEDVSNRPPPAPRPNDGVGRGGGLDWDRKPDLNKGILWHQSSGGPSFGGRKNEFPDTNMHAPIDLSGPIDVSDQTFSRHRQSFDRPGKFPSRTKIHEPLPPSFGRAQPPQHEVHGTTHTKTLGRLGTGEGLSYKRVGLGFGDTSFGGEVRQGLGITTARNRHIDTSGPQKPGVASVKTTHLDQTKSDRYLEDETGYWSSDGLWVAKKSEEKPPQPPKNHHTRKPPKNHHTRNPSDPKHSDTVTIYYSNLDRFQDRLTDRQTSSLLTSSDHGKPPTIGQRIAEMESGGSDEPLSSRPQKQQKLLREPSVPQQLLGATRPRSPLDTRGALQGRSGSSFFRTSPVLCL